MSVESWGNVDTLCTDKTGTLTQGKFLLDKFVDLKGEEDKNI
jgi:Mg2+-importing ATPase